MLVATTHSHPANTLAVRLPDDDLPTVHRVAIEHTFETAHRLPHLDGKCTSLHGHSWRVTVSVTAPHLSSDVTVVEFGALKAAVRHWIDTHLDHGTMLGFDDPFVETLTTTLGCKVFRFGADHTASEPETLATDLAWPTVEAVAVLLRRMSQHVLAGLPCADNARVGRVFVRETQLNTADYGPGDTA
ncbi:MAG: 6-pyruvoyl-tetrahydropterin synthase [Amycolatopsis sp.]|uniref:6-pyruvoyl trahydropterin synthase family protein n=1 Tax=Amycolatopsis sp. TaxID=37632 RepID=UPI0026197939|nr:6-carboxytetrahydropterin synthase [Amycolatopsis sp.]MCU1680258.1 6-pyruvoyl-tetrahydropterin synthase [Amycolatopsis sp.]